MSGLKKIIRVRRGLKDVGLGDARNRMERKNRR